MTREERLLDEQRAVRLQSASELLGESLMNTPVEVTSVSVAANGTHSPTSIPTDLTSARRWTVASSACGESSHASWNELDRPQADTLTDSTAFILTAVNPCFLRSLACSRTSEGRSPPIQPYTLARSRLVFSSFRRCGLTYTLPPSSSQTGTPSVLPLMSQSAMSRLKKENISKIARYCLIPWTDPERALISTSPPL